MHACTNISVVLLMVLQMLSKCQSQGASKRIPVGFQGMRGKKSLEYTDSEDFTGTDIEEKRADDLDGLKTNVELESLHPDSFVPNTYYSNRELFKRAPMGFMGMRGKKSTDEAGDYDPDSYQIDPEFWNHEIRSTDGLGSMLSNPDFPFTKIPHPPIYNPNGDSLSESFRYWDNNLVGSHPFGSYPFKIGKPILEGLQEETENEPLEEKRAPKNGFFGMRGKKNIGSFLRFRGKKEPSDYSFRGKFVGVRGKKSSGRIDNPLQVLIKRLNNQLYWQKRRGPDGFLGMRGKKWIRSVLTSPAGAGSVRPIS